MATAQSICCPAQTVSFRRRHVNLEQLSAGGRSPEEVDGSSG